MKRIITIISAVVLYVSASQIAVGQINRTLETKVADILAQLPTKDLNHSNRLMEEMISLDVEGILKFTDLLVPLGAGDDTRARYAVQSVAVYGGGHKNANSSKVVEQALLKALNKASDNEVKTFLMERLIVCGTNESISQLSKYLSDKDLHKPALATLRAIGTNEIAQTILEAAKTADNIYKPAFIEVLGQLQYAPAEALLYELGKSSSKDIQQRALIALAEIGSVDSMGYLISAAKASNYKLDDSKAILALIRFGNKLAENGKTDLSIEIGTLLLKNCTEEDQLHFRSAGIYLVNEGDVTKTLLKEIKKGDAAYKAAVLKAASQNLSSVNILKWVKAYKKASDETKPLIVNMLSKNNDAVIFEKCLIPAIQSNNESVKIAGIKALAYQKKEKALPVLLKSLKVATTSAEYKALEATLLRVVAVEDSEVLANALNGSNSGAKKVLVNVLALRNANDQFNTIVGLIKGADNDLKQTIYAALPLMASPDNLSDLIALLPGAKEETNISNVQKGIISVLKTNESVDSELIYEAYQNASEKSKWIPLLSALGSKKALKLVSDQLKTGIVKTKALALQTLSDWQNNDALPVMFEFVKNSTSPLQANAFNSYLRKVSKIWCVR